MLASPGYVAQVDAKLCVNCDSCADSCQFGAISVDDGVALVDAGACMGCGVCAGKCSQDAISLQREPGKGEPLEFQKLMVHAAQLRQAFSVWTG